MADRVLRMFARALAPAFLLALFAVPASAQSPAPSPGEGHAGGYTAATPWSQVQGGPTHAGTAVGGASVPAPPYKQAWRFDPSGDTGLAGPVIAGATVYAVGTNNVYALDLATGRQEWSVTRQEGPLVPPAVAATSGKEPPILVYTQGTKKDTALVGLDTATQKTLWTVPLEDDTYSGVTVDTDLAIVGNNAGKVFAVNVSTGKVAWSVVAAKGHIESAPAVGNSVVYYRVRNADTSAVSLVALDEATGKVEWQKGLGPIGGSTAGVILGSDGGLFTVVDTYASGEATAVDPSTGDVRWTSNLRTNVFPFSYPASVDGKMFAVDSSGGIYAFDSGSGARLWDYQVSTSSVRRGSPVVADGYVVVGLDDGTVVAVDSTTGHLVWQTNTGDGSIKTIAASPDLLIAAKGGDHGGLVAFANDPQGSLTDLVSVTQINVGRVVLAYVAAFVIVGAVILGAARLAGDRLQERVAPVADEELSADDEGDE